MPGTESQELSKALELTVPGPSSGSMVEGPCYESGETRWELNLEKSVAKAFV